MSEPRGKMTSGPWFADEARPTDWRIRKEDGADGFWEIAEMSTLNPEANARAIACLPELVEAARELVDSCACSRAKEAERMCLECEAVRRILARIDGGDNE